MSGGRARARLSFLGVSALRLRRPPRPRPLERRALGESWAPLLAHFLAPHCVPFRSFQTRRNRLFHSTFLRRNPLLLTSGAGVEAKQGSTARRGVLCLVWLSLAGRLVVRFPPGLGRGLRVLCWGAE